jgi:hypothetical protein
MAVLDRDGGRVGKQAGCVAVFLGVLSLPISNLGGFFFGTLLAATGVPSSAVCSDGLMDSSRVGALGVPGALGAADGVGAAAGADGASERAQSAPPSAAASGTECAVVALVSTAGGR